MFLRRAVMSNEETLVNFGTDAEMLLANEAFTRTVNTLIDSTLQAFLGSTPEESEKREDTYRHYKALSDVVNTLRQQVEVRDQINAKAIAQEEE
jgi:hypothetical protein